MIDVQNVQTYEQTIFLMILGEIPILGVVYYNIISDPKYKKYIHTSYNRVNYNVIKEQYD
jgi:hypothetical protein